MSSANRLTSPKEWFEGRRRKSVALTLCSLMLLALLRPRIVISRLFMGGNSPSNMSSPIVIKPRSTHTATIIFFHGLGDTGDGWADTFKQFSAPHLKIICPNAPHQPVTINGGMKMPSWFDLYTLSTGPEDKAGIIQASKTAHELIEEEEKLGIPSDRILLGGFSQGGALALYSALKYKKNLAGIIALSCWLPLHQSFPSEIVGNKDTPVLQCHGNADMVVPHSYGSKSSEILKSMMSNVTFKTYSNLGHSSSKEEMDEVEKFVQGLVPQK